MMSRVFVSMLAPAWRALRPAGVLLDPTARIPDGLLIAYNSVAQATRKVCSFLNTPGWTDAERRGHRALILLESQRKARLTPGVSLADLSCAAQSKNGWA